ncbi:MAG TPA: hypothetical protein DEF51_48485 [Myxococcales bacterium]|nr:hypothetical protein [Myxococcales bacterium]
MASEASPEPTVGHGPKQPGAHLALHRLGPFVLGRPVQRQPADAALVVEPEPGQEPFRGRAPESYAPPGLLDGTPEAWAEWWERWKPDQPGRFRWGAPRSTRSTAHELCEPEFLQRDRLWALLEHGLYAPAPPLDVVDLVVRQRAALVGVRRGAPQA